MLKFTKSHDYDSNKLIDFLREKLAVKSDAQLAFILHMQPTQISKMRSKKECLSSLLLLRASELLDLPTKDLKSIALG